MDYTIAPEKYVKNYEIAFKCNSTFLLKIQNNLFFLFFWQFDYSMPL